MTKQVRIIPAKPKNELKQEQKKGKLRVAAYCRVSTDDQEQLTSYKNRSATSEDRTDSHRSWKTRQPSYAGFSIVCCRGAAPKPLGILQQKIAFRSGYSVMRAFVAS